MPDDRPVVEVTMRDIYDMLVALRDHTAQLANNAAHAENWRVKADSELGRMDERLDRTNERLGGMVSRRELYSVVTAVAAVASALAPFIAQLYAAK